MLKQKWGYYWAHLFSLSVFLCLNILSANALEFSVPSLNKSLIGTIQEVYSEPGDTLANVAKRYNVGYVELREANPRIHPERLIMDWTKVTIPSQYILPSGPRVGVVINLAELRLYHYLPGTNTVMTTPVGIGREGWGTPLGRTTIRRKVKNPTWYPPASVREEAAQMGYDLPRIVPPGPDNPLGDYAMRLGWPSYLIHSTNRPEGVGRRSSAGCIRMYPDDAERLFQLVERGTPVRVINQAYKTAWDGNKLYLEAHQPLQEDTLNDGAEYAPLVESILTVAKQKGRYYKIDWQTVRKEASHPSGIPVVIGHVL